MHPEDNINICFNTNFEHHDRTRGKVRVTKVIKDQIQIKVSHIISKQCHNSPNLKPRIFILLKQFLFVEKNPVIVFSQDGIM